MISAAPAAGRVSLKSPRSVSVVVLKTAPVGFPVDGSIIETWTEDPRTNGPFWMPPSIWTGPEPPDPVPPGPVPPGPEPPDPVPPGPAPPGPEPPDPEVLPELGLPPVPSSPPGVHA